MQAQIPRVPIICTGNDFSTLYAPLIRDGRMEKFYWNPTREDRIGACRLCFHLCTEYAWQLAWLSNTWLTSNSQASLLRNTNQGLHVRMDAGMEGCHSHPGVLQCLGQRVLEVADCTVINPSTMLRRRIVRLQVCAWVSSSTTV